VASIKDCNRQGHKKLQVFGGSKLMVDWANLKWRINNLLLETLMMHFLQVKESYETLSFSHIYREFNLLADQLSIFKGSTAVAGKNP
jgi:hypothetical protein